MSKITQDDIQRIGDEDTLMLFLEEKLNVPIQAEATLAQIALPLPLPFLGLDDTIAEQIIDCQDFSGLPKDAVGERRPFLIRFRSEQDYSDILRDVAESLHRKHADPADLFFICTAQNFRPFAFAYFSEPAAGGWYATVLTILVWTKNNTHIHTSSEHELPASFFPHKSPVELDDVPEDDIEFEEKNDLSEKNVILNEPKNDTENARLEKQNNAFPDHTVKRTLSKDLLAKLENTGARLRENWNIYDGIVTGCNEAFLISEFEHRQLISEDPKSSVVIKSQLQLSQKWQATPSPLIYIPSSADRSWNWSNRSRTEAEHIFAENYPAIRKYLRDYKSLLNKPKFKTEFYWELPPSKLHPHFKHPKIVYPFIGSSMRASYDRSGALVLRPAFFIPTEDLSLLAILNSKIFDWYAKAKYKEKGKASIEFKQKNMMDFPIAVGSEAQKAEISLLVEQILESPNSPEAPDIESEIDEWIYELYELTGAEIALVKGGHHNA